MQEFPNNALETLSIEYAERYVAEHSDFVVSPSHYMRNWVCEEVG
jgi:hypothetical protein